MSKYLISLLLACGLASFATQSFADAKAGEAVVKASDCLMCHSGSMQSMGVPLFKDIAAKYKGADKAQIAKLAEKIKAGGQGVWTTKMSMVPHAAMSEADRISAVEWVLAQK
jgi:cytochrome c